MIEASKTALIALTLLALATAPAAAQDARDDALDRASAAEAAGDPVAAVRILTLAANAGDRAAAAQLGDIYRGGELVAQDLSAAAAWYRAAGRGQASALNALGRMTFSGLGVLEDRDAALILLRDAAALGVDPAHAHDYAAALESRGGDGDLATARDYYAEAAAAGHAPSMTSLGVLYLEGRGVARDPDQARALFEQAAEAGDARGANNLGLLYARADGVEQDYERAAELFQRAVDQGLREAMSNLAVLYENGFGVALDEAAAVRLYREAGVAERAGFDGLLALLEESWSERLAPFDPSPAAAARDAAAAEAGDPLGLYAMGYRFAHGQGRPLDPVRAAQLYRRAAETGFSPARLALGVLYVRGVGAPQNYVEAYRLLNQAAAAGEPGAAELRDALLQRMSASQRALTGSGLGPGGDG